MQSDSYFFLISSEALYVTNYFFLNKVIKGFEQKTKKTNTIRQTKQVYPISMPLKLHNVVFVLIVTESRHQGKAGQC